MLRLSRHKSIAHKWAPTDWCDDQAGSDRARPRRLARWSPRSPDALRRSPLVGDVLRSRYKSIAHKWAPTDGATIRSAAIELGQGVWLDGVTKPRRSS